MAASAVAHHKKMESASSKNFQQKLFYPGSKKRKVFGLLERPSVPPSVPQVSYKVLLQGSSGSGKTYLVNRLAGIETSQQILETVGIEVTHVYWPMKIGNRLMLFRLELWDTGDQTAKKYNHISPACREACDGVLLCFSMCSIDQFENVGSLAHQLSQTEHRPAIIGVATRFDRPTEMCVSEPELRTLEAKRSLPILRLPPLPSQADDVPSVTPLLNAICRNLWQRDQRLLNKGKE